MNVIELSVQAYQKHHHLKLAAKDVGIPWQTLYTHLKKAGVAVIGNKSKYGTDWDKFGAKAEKDFLDIVPFAKNMNEIKFQNKVDYMVADYGIDVKASRLHSAGARTRSKRWNFSIKKQLFCANFFVYLGYNEDKNSIKKILLIPGEVCRGTSGISLSYSGGKWSDYEVTEQELHDFFVQMTSIPKEKP